MQHQQLMQLWVSSPQLRHQSSNSSQPWHRNLLQSNNHNPAVPYGLPSKERSII